MSQYATLSHSDFTQLVTRMTNVRPLVHCMTNDVVQEITADVLLASGASPAMIIAEEECVDFARIASTLLVNVGTIFPERVQSMIAAIETANEEKKPWVLDPVAAGVLPWRDDVIDRLLRLRPTVVRGNASEIMAIVGASAGGKGVDSLDDSVNAISAARKLAQKVGCVVAVTGASDFVTDGEDVIEIPGGHVMATLVVGTGCSLSALVAAFCAACPCPLTATAAALMLAKRAEEIAFKESKGPGSFHAAYLDALYQITQGK